MPLRSGGIKLLLLDEANEGPGLNERGTGVVDTDREIGGDLIVVPIREYVVEGLGLIPVHVGRRLVASSRRH